MTDKISTLKPQDIVVLLKLLVSPGQHMKIVDLSYNLGISASEVSQALKRLQNSFLISQDTKQPLSTNIIEFLKFGIKYVFPSKLSSVSRGVPTAHSMSPLSEQIASDRNEQYVWASEEGSTRGHSIIPLYPSVPQAALKDPKLHELLALVDAIRIGRSREQEIAKTELEKIILK
jgi:DNA-binding transcriptional ArsR family regulator